MERVILWFGEEDSSWRGCDDGGFEIDGWFEEDGWRRSDDGLGWGLGRLTRWRGRVKLEDEVNRGCQDENVSGSTWGAGRRRALHSRRFGVVRRVRVPAATDAAAAVPGLHDRPLRDRGQNRASEGHELAGGRRGQCARVVAGGLGWRELRGDRRGHGRDRKVN